MTGSNCWCLEAFRDGDFVSQNVDVIECSRLLKAERAGAADLTAGMKYHASVALRVGSRELGIMNLGGPHWRALGERDLHLLATLGAHIGMAVDRANLRESAQRLARTEERTRLARDIHDTLAQDLTAIALQLEAALRHLGDAGDARVRVEKALTVTREALGDARESVLTLRSDPLGGKPLGASPRRPGSLRPFAIAPSARSRIRPKLRCSGSLRKRSQTCASTPGRGASTSCSNATLPEAAD